MQDVSMAKDLIYEFLGFCQADLSRAERLSLGITEMLAGVHEDEAVIALVICTVVALRSLSTPEKIATLAGILEHRAGQVRALHAIPYGRA